MLNIEYSLFDIDNNENEIKTKIAEAIKYNISSIIVPFAHTKLCRSMTKNTNILVGNAIDYPMGFLDTESRNCAINKAIDNGAQKINIVIQTCLLANRKYDKIKEDIQKNYETCQSKGIELSYYLDYRTFTHQSLIKACSLLIENNIQKVYVSTGHFLDDPDDNLIAVILLKDKTKIQTIFNGNVWTKKHIDNLRKNKIQYMSFNNLYGIRLINN
jgi:deoxyribose-phosphate aldolase